MKRLSSQLQLKKAAHERTLSNDRGTIIQNKLSEISEDSVNLFFEDQRSSANNSINESDAKVSFLTREETETLIKSKTVGLSKMGNKFVKQ